MEKNHRYYEPETRVWSGKKRTPLYNPEVNLGQLILQKFRQNINEVYQISANSTVHLTRGEIITRSIKIANKLIKSGVSEGEVVGLIADNSENLTSIMFACLSLGLPINPLATIMNETDITFMWSTTRPKVIFCDAHVYDLVRVAVEKMELNVKIFIVQGKVDGIESVDDILEEENCDVEKFEFPHPNVPSASSIAFIMCSSGTTSLPKGVCKSHKQFITQVFPPWRSNLSQSDIILSIAPAYWVSHIWFIVMAALYEMKIVITTDKITPESWMRLIDEFEVTTAVCTPGFGSQLLKSSELRPLKSIKTVTVGATAFSEQLIASLKPIFPNGSILRGYGCTEGDVVTYSTDGESEKGASSGCPYDNVVIKIIDKRGNSLPPNEAGEICFKTPVAFSSYFNSPELYASAFDADGFIKSGDIGYFNDSGQLFVIDRIKHMIKAKDNYQVTPLEIEELIEAIDGVQQSCVVGVFDDSVFHEIIYAFVEKKEEASDITEEFIERTVNMQLIEVKKITGGVHFIEEFPLTPTGKVQKRKVKEIAQKMHEKKESGKEKFEICEEKENVLREI